MKTLRKLGVGDVAYTRPFTGSNALRRHDIDRVTNTMAISGSLRIKNEPREFYGEVVCSIVASYGYAYPETDKLKNEYRDQIVRKKLIRSINSIDISSINTKSLRIIEAQMNPINEPI